MTENNALEPLSQYREIQARMHVLSTYSIGAGITVSRMNEEDQLQELHRRLKGIPTYMYLNKREQELENVAHAYLVRYPTGTRAQLAAIPKSGVDQEDDELLQELRGKIKKVIAARGWEVRDDIDAVLERLTEFQDLRAKLNRVDTVLKALEEYRSEYARLLRLRYIDGLNPGDIALRMNITDRTFRRWRTRAEKEFVKLSG